ncbi:MAG: WecB/TagA/CpsF family glycosyltransferase [Prolixibacteraceae bacterium]|nr:WecB/TagA/CpsF family glycosyltransferase [Prolixibacteraceae bacterium]
MLKEFSIFDQSLSQIADGKKLINTINAHCYILALTDNFYHEALLNCDVLLPDGISIVHAIRWLNGKRIKKIAGADLFFYELNRLQKTGGKCFFLGSTDKTLTKINNRIRKEYPNIKVQSYSPPYKSEFSDEDNSSMIDSINSFQPDVLMIGMTAPKQEKWAYKNFDKLNAGHVCCIGAVFDFYAGTVGRAPKWLINIGFEWLYRLLREPKRMWRRYLIGNSKFIWQIFKELIYNRNEKKSDSFKAS